MYAAELLLDRPLAKGETCPYELTIEPAEPLAETWVDHYAARRLTELLVWVRFDPSGCRPTSSGTPSTAATSSSEKLELGDGRSVHALARGFGPGVLGLRWGW